MKILSHRGYWKSVDDKNTTASFRRSFELGFGTETDLRDCNAILVVSHDPASTGCLSADELLEIHDRSDPSLVLALNVKADGLQSLLVAALERRKPRDAFVFDMSVPDMIQWLKTGVPVFTRHSDVENVPMLYDQAAGVWLDGFRSDWWSGQTITHHLDRNKRVCIVSPELHRREHLAVWQRLRQSGLARNSGVMLCTDYPEQAQEFFANAD